MGIPMESIILYGTSMGTAASIYLAAHNRAVAGVILESPFESIVRTVTNFFGGRLVDMFPSYMRIGAIEAPVFILHGENDEVSVNKVSINNCSIIACSVSISVGALI